MNKLLLACAVALACAAPAMAADSAVNGMPPFGQDKPIPVPKIIKKTLPNGLQIWVIPRDGLPRVDYVLAVRNSGLASDDRAHPGFARLLSYLLNEGTAKHDSRAIAEAAQGMGGSVGGDTGIDGLSVSANAMASHAAPMMQLLAEVARTPSFPAKEVELAKVNALQSLKVQETQPRFRAERALNQAIYGDHPYGHTDPTFDAITSVTPELLKAEHAKRFRPDRALLVVTGKIKAADAIKLATAAFGDWKANGPAADEGAAAPATAKPVHLLLERQGSVQSALRLGRPGVAATSADYVPLRLASTIIGGGFSSRVNMNLREAKGYTYGAFAGARPSRIGGSIVGGAEVRNEVTGASLKEFFSEYNKLATELVPDSELTMNKRYVAGGYLIANQLQGAVAYTLANNWLSGLPAEFLGQYVPLVQKVSAEQVREMGKKYFTPESQSIVVVGDPAAVADQLKAYGEFTVQAK